MVCCISGPCILPTILARLDLITFAQEDPYKLVILAKDINQFCVTNADFFFSDGELAFITGDEDGVIRMYEYNPHGTVSSCSVKPDKILTSSLDPESKNGQHLLLRTEFHGQSEYRTSALVTQRTKEEVMPPAKLICGAHVYLIARNVNLTPLHVQTGSTDGSLTSLTPVTEPVAKRLQLLQGQLTRNIQHVAGLNPKALRSVNHELTPIFIILNLS